LHVRRRGAVAGRAASRSRLAERIKHDRGIILTDKAEMAALIARIRDLARWLDTAYGRSTADDVTALRKGAALIEAAERRVVEMERALKQLLTNSSVSVHQQMIITEALDAARTAKEGEHE